MNTPITLLELGQVILFIALIIAIVYIVILVRNINQSMRVFKDLLKENKKELDDTLKNLPNLSNNLVEITGTAKEELKVVAGAVDNIKETTEMAASTVSIIRNDIVGKAKGILELLHLAKNVLLKEDEDSNKDKKSA